MGYQIEDTKIYLIDYWDESISRRMVSHGVGNNSLRNYCLPWDTLTSFMPYERDDNGPYIEVKRAASEDAALASGLS